MTVFQGDIGEKPAFTATRLRQISGRFGVDRIENKKLNREIPKLRLKIY